MQYLLGNNSINGNISNSFYNNLSTLSIAILDDFVRITRISDFQSAIRVSREHLVDICFGGAVAESELHTALCLVIPEHGIAISINVPSFGHIFGFVQAISCKSTISSKGVRQIRKENQKYTYKLAVYSSS